MSAGKEPKNGGRGMGTPMEVKESAPNFGTNQRKALNSEDFRGDETSSNPEMGARDVKKSATMSGADAEDNRDDQPSRPDGVS
jgi:hypothetical protein